MATAAKLIFGVLVLIVLFAIGTTWSNRTSTSTGLGLFGAGAGQSQSAVAGTSTNAASTPFGY